MPGSPERRYDETRVPMSGRTRKPTMTANHRPVLSPIFTVTLASLLALPALTSHAQTAPAAAPPPVAAAPVPAVVAPPMPPPAAANSRVGPYAIAAVGRNDYDYGCWFFTSCENARSTSGKLGLGYRFGVFAFEGWLAEYGKGNTNDSGGSVRLRSVGASASWLIRFGDVAEGLLRVGLADVHLARNSGGTTASGSKFQPTFGLGIGFLVTPVTSVEFAWDITSGDTSNIGTVRASSASVGLRVRF